MGKGDSGTEYVVRHTRSRGVTSKRVVMNGDENDDGWISNLVMVHFSIGMGVFVEALHTEMKRAKSIHKPVAVSIGVYGSRVYKSRISEMIYR